MFLQIHTLTSYHASLLNRDDAGLAKRIPFGNAVRIRVSSQCLKRHWRNTLQQTIPLPSGLRSRQFFSREILPRVQQGLQEANFDESEARARAEDLTLELISGLLKVSKDKKKLEGLELKQPVLFGKPEADYLVRLILDCARRYSDPDASKAAIKEAVQDIKKQITKDQKANFMAMLKAAGFNNLYAGLEGALFGRFVTSDILARSDACVHVAHAFTVHRAQAEVDYFTVVDDLNLEEETGAAHAGDMELFAGLFYGYVVVDIPLLLSNLTGCTPEHWRQQDSNDAKAILEGLVKAITTVTPGAKLGATAPYSRAELVLLETGPEQPRSLANAFLEALTPRDDMMQQAINTLCSHIDALDAMYGRGDIMRFAASTKNLRPVQLKLARLSEGKWSITEGSRCVEGIAWG